MAVQYFMQQQMLIAKTAIKMANHCDTVLIGDDTDLLVILCSRAQNITHKLFFRPEQKLNSRKITRCWDIVALQRSLGKNVCQNLLFVHALLGCDTTSRLFGVGKSVALKKVKSSTYFQQQAAMFSSPMAKKDDIIKAGQNALVSIYKGKPGQSLDSVRLQAFHQKVSSSSTYVQPRNLHVPPTSAAAQYHSLRVYHQVQQWCGNELPPEDWGWMNKENTFIPIATNLKPAPAYLLEAISCNCKSGCNTRRCGCRKYGLDCSLACGECKGIHCSNVTHTNTYNDSDIESENESEM